MASGTLGKLHGCVLIAGTGTIAYGFTEDGREARAAGAGPIFGDWGRYMPHFLQFQFRRAKSLLYISNVSYMHILCVLFWDKRLWPLTRFRVNGYHAHLLP